MMPPIFLIHLDKSTDRLAQSAQQLDAAGLTFTRISAVDGRELSASEMQVYDEAATLSFIGRPLNRGEIGCYLSHLSGAQHVLESGQPYGIVLEDDVSIPPHAPQAINEILEWLNAHPQDWDLINISALKAKITTRLMALQSVKADHSLMHAHYFPMMATGLLWSRAGAEKFVTQHSKIWCPVDNFFRDWLTKSNTGLSVYPPLVTPRGDDSDITAIGAERCGIKKTKYHKLLKTRRIWADKRHAWRHKYF